MRMLDVAVFLMALALLSLVTSIVTHRRRMFQASVLFFIVCSFLLVLSCTGGFAYA